MKRKANECAEVDARAGLTKIELLVVIAVIAAFVLWAMTIPNPNSRAKVDRIKCINNLKNIGLAFRIASTDSSDDFEVTKLLNTGVEMASLDALRVFGLHSNELSAPKLLHCPSDKLRNAATDFQTLKTTNISYFVSLSAAETNPAGFLAGDRNLATNGVMVGAGLFALTTNTDVSWTKEMHGDQGNVAMADGSVQQMSSSRLRQAVREQKVDTNWLVFP